MMSHNERGRRALASLGVNSVPAAPSMIRVRELGNGADPARLDTLDARL